MPITFPVVVPDNFIVTHVVVPDNLIVTEKLRADKIKLRSTATPESIYNIAEILIAELDARAKHIRSLGLFG